MHKLFQAFIPATLLTLVSMSLLSGCASLEPLPRFRTSSTTFAPDQLPPAHRSVSSLSDPVLVGAYSVIKEERERALRPVTFEDVRDMLRNQESQARIPYRDQVGLDTEYLEDELAAGEEFGSEEPPLDQAFIQRVMYRSSLASIDETVETNPAVNRVDMMKEIITLLGIRYRYGGDDAMRGLDCSAFTGTIYSRALGVRLPRSSAEQFSVGSKIKREYLKVGDLVFFKTRRKRAPVSHVGIYVGENLFAHASTRHGVIISTLAEGYYNKTYVGARRVLSSDFSEARMR